MAKLENVRNRQARMEKKKTLRRKRRFKVERILLLAILVVNIIILSKI